MPRWKPGITFIIQTLEGQNAAVQLFNTLTVKSPWENRETSLKLLGFELLAPNPSLAPLNLSTITETQN